MKRRDASTMKKRKPSTQPTANMKSVRVVILGKDGVGKSALTVRFLTKRFIGEYDSTLESTYRQLIEVDNEYLSVVVTDTAGENSALKLDRCLTQGEIFLVLYSITDRTSFEEATRIGNYVKDRKNSDSVTFTLVGTKKDLEHFRVVHESEGSDLAQELDTTFCELSISESDGYKEVSEMIMRSLKQYFKRDKIERQLKTNNSSLLKMKEGLIKRTGSFRRKSVALCSE